MTDDSNETRMKQKTLNEQSQVEAPAAQAQSEPLKKTHNAFVIAIANQKGGVAKTTSAAALGGALHNMGYEVLVVDLDAQANLTLALGKDPARVRGAVTDVFFNSATILNVSRETTIPGLDIVPSNSGMELAERFLPVRKNYEYILQKALTGAGESLSRIDGSLSSLESQPASTFENFTGRSPYTTETAQQAYDYIILDCPPFIGAITLNAMVAADMLIIPAQPEFFSAHALRAMMTTVRQIRETHNPTMIYRILVTMVDQRNRIHRDVLEQIKTTFGTGVLKTIIQIDTKLRESAVAGLPITHYQGKSRGSLQYTALANELVDYIRTRSVDPTVIKFR
jgi:chromosome partitioning protein